MYLTYARHDPEIAEDAVLTSARLLLDAGADPNAGYLWHGLLGRDRFLRDPRIVHHPLKRFVKVNRDYSGVDPWPAMNMSQTGSWASPGRKARRPDGTENRSV